ncbi:TPA: OmpA family protein [Vibrio vulnificus]
MSLTIYKIEKIKLSPLAFVFLLALSSTANAREAEVRPTGYWLGAGVGLGGLDDSIPANAEKENSHAFSAKLDGGYDFTENVGLYGSYDFYQNRLRDDNINMATIGVLGKEALTENVNIFGKAGATLAIDGNNSNGFAGTFGAGVEFRLTHRLSTVFGVDYYDDIQFSREGGSGDLYQAYWGLTYRFNQPETPWILTKEVIKEVPHEVVKIVPQEVVKKVEVVRNVPIVLSSSTGSTLFAHNSSVLESTLPLKGILDEMKKSSSSHLTVRGYSDSQGSEKYNLWLSERRAKSVAEYFERNGIDKARITYEGLGEKKPIANNNTEVGRAQNRRVELTIN